MGADIHAAERQSCILQVRMLKAIAREGQGYFRPLVRYLMETSGGGGVIKDFQEKRMSYVSCGYSKRHDKSYLRENGLLWRVV